ncbi:MAG: host attachment protein [Woeseiaceae bacterium]
MANAKPRAEKAYWIVVADESHAIIYTRNTRRGPLQKLYSLDNADGRKKAGELLADRGGRSYDSFGAGRHTMAKEKTDPKKHVAMAFAKKIAERIGKVTHDGSCRGYALVAAPRFLGMLRDAVSTTCKFEAFKTIDKEVVDRDTAFLKKLVDSD